MYLQRASHACAKIKSSLKKLRIFANKNICALTFSNIHNVYWAHRIQYVDQRQYRVKFRSKMLGGLC